MTDRLEHLRMVEALLFASPEPVDAPSLAERLPDGVNIPDLLDELKEAYAGRGVNLVCAGQKWMFRTAPDLGFLLQKEVEEQRRLSRAAIETLAIIAYHQPVTRAEIEAIRGVGLSKGTLDLLLETGWVRPLGRRRSPGRPATYGTSQDFLTHFGLESLDALPGLEELKAAGLLDSDIPPGFLAEPQSDEEQDGDAKDEAATELPLTDGGDTT
ncbi:MAG: SMC-Scp complex subunit ScpB [Sphingomonadales bacterium]